MNYKNERQETQRVLFYVPVLFVVTVTLFLFYIDEGYYNFNWMKDTGNWIVFFIYCITLFAAYIPVRLLLRRRSGIGTELASCFIGFVAGLALLFWMLGGS